MKHDPSPRPSSVFRSTAAGLLVSFLGSPLAAAQCEVQELRGLEIANPLPLGGFGYTVALSGDTAFVGWWFDENNTAGSGSVYVFERGPSGWKRTNRFYPGAGKIHFATVAVKDDHAACCGWRKSAKAGKAYFYERGPGGWQEVGTAKPADLEWDDEYGAAIAIDGDVAAVTSPKDDGACPADPQCNSGSVYVYERGPSGWTQQQKLVASDAGPFQLFGSSVAIEGDRMVIGSYTVIDPAWKGAVYVFERQAGVWVETARVYASEDTGANWYALRLALSGDRFVTCAQRQDEARGAVYVYDLVGGSWVETKLSASDGDPGDHFGSGLALDGDRLLVGADQDDEGGSMAGSAYLFEHGPGGWVQTAKLRAPQPQANDWFGWDVALEGDTALVAAPIVLWKKNERFGSVHVFSIPDNASQFCHGTSCPCGNEDSSAGCVNSTGRGAVLAGCGSTSVAVDDFVLRASSLPAHGFAVVAMGAGSSPAPLGDGRLCIASGGLGVYRFAVRDSGPAGVISEGPGIVATSQTFGGSGQIVAGQTWNFQAFYRDADGGCGGGLNTTNAVGVTFVP